MKRRQCVLPPLISQSGVPLAHVLLGSRELDLGIFQVSVLGLSFWFRRLRTRPARILGFRAQFFSDFDLIQRAGHAKSRARVLGELKQLFFRIRSKFLVRDFEGQGFELNRASDLDLGNPQSLEP